MEVQAVAKYVRRTPRKARLIADSVKGMPVSEALALLEFSPRHAATDVAKVIKSAAANAEHNFNLNREDLFLKLLLVDEGPTMKRIRPVSRGMAHQYFRRTSHITAIVEDRPAPAPVRRAERRRRTEEVSAPPRRGGAGRKPAAVVEAPPEVVEEQPVAIEEQPAVVEEQSPPPAEDAATSPPSGEESQEGEES